MAPYESMPARIPMHNFTLLQTVIMIIVMMIVIMMTMFVLLCVQSLINTLTVYQLILPVATNCLLSLIQITLYNMYKGH